MARGRGLLVAGVLVAAIGCAREAVPTELIGRWTSDDPRYADRSLEIGAQQIAFGVDAGIRISYRLRGVERETDGASGVLYRLVYDGSGEPERELQVRIPTAGRLRIENHSELWTRSDAPSKGS